MQVFAKNEPAVVPEGSIVMKMYTLTELGLVAGVAVHHNPYPRVLIGSGEGAREITMGRRDFPHGLQGPYPTLSKEERDKAPQFLKEAGLRCPHLGEVWEFRDLLSEMYWDPQKPEGTLGNSPGMEERNRLIKAGCPICGAPWASATPHGVVHVDAALSDGVDLRRRAETGNLKHGKGEKHSADVKTAYVDKIVGDVKLARQQAIVCIHGERRVVGDGEDADTCLDRGTHQLIHGAGGMLGVASMAV